MHFPVIKAWNKVKIEQDSIVDQLKNFEVS